MNAVSLATQLERWRTAGIAVFLPLLPHVVCLCVRSFVHSTKRAVGEQGNRSRLLHHYIWIGKFRNGYFDCEDALKMLECCEKVE